MLEANDIEVFIKADDCGGMRTDVSMLMGNTRLMVKEKDRDRALVLLEEDKGKESAWYREKKRDQQEKVTKSAPYALTTAILTLIFAASILWIRASSDLMVVGVLLAFVSFVAWGVWISAVLVKKELRKKNLK